MILTRFLTCSALALTLAACGGSPSKPNAEASKILPTIGSSGGARSNIQAKKLFGAKADGSRQSSAAYGSYSKGCVAGAQQLAETGPTWQAMRLSRNRNWGHPEMIDYIKTLSAKAAQQPGWEGLYVGDISQPRGGPMLTGHASHQMGLDADFWMLPPKGWFGTRVTQSHLAHHFQDHDATYHVSIGMGWIDRLFGTAHDRDTAKARYDRKTILSMGMDPEDLRLVTARKAYGLPKIPGNRRGPPTETGA